MQSFWNALPSGCLRVSVCVYICARVFSLEYSLLCYALYSLWSVLFGLILLVVIKLSFPMGSSDFTSTRCVYVCASAWRRKRMWGRVRVRARKKFNAKLSSAGRFPCSKITKLYIPQSIRSHIYQIHIKCAELPSWPVVTHFFSMISFMFVLQCQIPRLSSTYACVCSLFTPISLFVSLSIALTKISYRVAISPSLEIYVQMLIAPTHTHTHIHSHSFKCFTIQNARKLLIWLYVRAYHYRITKYWMNVHRSSHSHKHTTRHNLTNTHTHACMC